MPAIPDFHTALVAALPRLRVYAMSLTRDRDRADDLVQDTVVKALVNRESFQPGTSLPGWLFTIQRNEFITGLRRARHRDHADIDDIAESAFSAPGNQDARADLRDAMRAFFRLPERQRDALRLVGIEGERYEDAAAMLGVPLGTVKAAVSRGRAAMAAEVG
jgi:RNA polymerase sigma-70 factor (ECF subfamily)